MSPEQEMAIREKQQVQGNERTRPAVTSYPKWISVSTMSHCGYGQICPE
jgi:hypothetical protein